MGANTGTYSRNMFSEVKKYVARRVTMGIPWVDADDNDIEQARYNIGRRLQQILGDLAIGDGFLCVGTGLNNDFEIRGGDGTAEGAGRFWLKGHNCFIQGATTFKNIGADEDGRSINPRITTIQYQSGPNQTLVDDSAANWVIGEHNGKTLTPDITQPGSTFTIVSNTQTQLVVTGDATTVAQVGDNYRIELTTPSGVDRIDGVFLNVYLDEYDCTDDPNLIHNLTTNTCAQLRTKLIQTLYVKEGSESFPDYTDSDGNYHWTFQVARIYRYNGIDAIWDIDDLRKVVNPDVDYPDLTNAGSNLKVVPSDPEADTVDVLPGWWTLSDRSAIKKLPVRTTSPTFGPIGTPGNVRYDLLSIADDSSLQVKTGTEVAYPGDPFLNAPAPDMDKLVLGIIRITETGAVLLNKEDITDSREFLNIGMAANALANFYAALWLRPHAQTVPDNTVRIEWGRYYNSTGTNVINKSAGFNSPVFPPATTGNERYDLLVMDDTGNPVIISGVEVPAGTGDPWVNHPDVPFDQFCLAIVKVDEDTTVVVSISDVTDVREFLNKGGGSGPALWLRPHAQLVPNNTLRIESGRYIDSTGTIVINKATAFNSPTFGTVTTGNERYDLVVMNDAGNSLIVTGAEVPAGTGDPFVNAPAIPSGRLAVAIVKVDEDTTVVVNTADVTDVREFLNKGGAGGPAATGCPPPTVDELLIATQGQTIFDLSTSYSLGNNTLKVYRNGALQNITEDYTETTSSRITFNYALNAGERVRCIQYGAAVGDNIIASRQVFTATASQTVFTTTFTYEVGKNQIIVTSGGVVMEVNEDYAETDPNTITFYVGRTLGERIVVRRIGTTNADAMKLYELQVAAAGQTVFNLVGSYTVGAKSLQVFRNGKLLMQNAYTETDSQTVTLISGCVVGDEILFMVAGGDVVSCADSGVIAYEKHTATANQVTFNLGFNYTIGSHGLIVTRNGRVEAVGITYLETGTSQVTFSTGCQAGDEVEFRYLCKVFGPMLSQGALSWHLFDGNNGDLVVGQTVLTIPFTYGVGTHNLRVYRNGQELTVDIGYTEDSATQITLTTAVMAPTEYVEVFTIASALSGSRNHLIEFHDDFDQVLPAGQSYRNLAIECTLSDRVVIKAGTTVLPDSWRGGIKFTSDTTVIITNSGANGLDTGVETADTWYYIWAIKNPVTGVVAGMFSTDSVSPVLPSGYTKKRLIGVVRNDSSSNFVTFFQFDNEVTCHSNEIHDAASTTAVVTVNANSFVPPLSSLCRVLCKIRHDGTVIDAYLYSAPSSSGGVVPRTLLSFIDGSTATGIFDSSESLITLSNGSFSLWSSQNGQWAHLLLNGYTLTL